MASCLEIVDDEYIEELKDKSENENTKNTEHGVVKESFQKVGEWENLQASFKHSVILPSMLLTCNRKGSP